MRLSKSPSVGEGARVDFWDDEEEDFELLLAPRSWSVGSCMERVGQWLLMGNVLKCNAMTGLECTCTYSIGCFGFQGYGITYQGRVLLCDIFEALSLLLMLAADLIFMWSSSVAGDLLQAFFFKSIE